MNKLDLNCDMGESYGAWKMGDDLAVLPYVSSANIACGFHGGDPATMRKTVAAAIEHGVAVGAHPSLPDLLGFGRREIRLSPQEAYDCVVVQIGALAAVAASQGGTLHHVKAHGALYNMAARDAALADAICRAMRDVNPELIVYGLAGSELIRAGEALGLRVAQEVFGDRSYESDGSLTPRSLPGAMIEDADASLRQVLSMVQRGRVATRQGTEVEVRADTLCLHGDQPGAAQFAKKIRADLEAKGVVIATV
ncbi:LamB/YcsF family protein [Candidimonas nitroreducens]|uniref:5-oxoprolinase subunit A n=1 Tax=Candidimonas nitroreducens TaxID=683354 RepID=A0A225MCQ8_9BURK|nr:5-oxoprolinase subunit PxpA [Candidimonas nitroreducens]OWT59026.1 lactam utilization protein LamB [Candidimonas nitroreducens]